MNTTRTENRLKNTQDPCIWMQAGVIPQKFCKMDYDCIACRFDKALRRLAAENEKLRELGILPNTKRGKIVFWKAPLMGLPPWKRPCIHHLKKRIEFRACTNEYRCDNCEFDQYFYDEYTVHAIVKPVDVLNIEGFKIPQGFYLHHGHTWIKLEGGGEARIGLDDFALRLFGPLDMFQSPLVGKEIRQNRSDIKMKRGSNSASIQSPAQRGGYRRQPQVKRAGQPGKPKSLRRRLDRPDSFPQPAPGSEKSDDGQRSDRLFTGRGPAPLPGSRAGRRAPGHRRRSVRK